jgi:hypothetical protein
MSIDFNLHDFALIKARIEKSTVSKTMFLNIKVRNGDGKTTLDAGIFPTHDERLRPLAIEFLNKFAKLCDEYNKDVQLHLMKLAEEAVAKLDEQGSEG